MMNLILVPSSLKLNTIVSNESFAQWCCTFDWQVSSGIRLLVHTEPTVQAFRHRSRCVESSSCDFRKCHSVQDQQTDSILVFRPHERTHNHPVVLVLGRKKRSKRKIIRLFSFCFLSKHIALNYLSIGIRHENWFAWINPIFLPHFLGLSEGVDLNELRIKF